MGVLAVGVAVELLWVVSVVELVLVASTRVVSFVAVVVLTLGEVATEPTLVMVSFVTAALASGAAGVLVSSVRALDFMQYWLGAILQ